ncbi:hypothetical protein MFMK1_000637 [Metallumcola ferriviriculae]|uniref:Uncharacterized protein n=1 Tax=Metallumcola ferriviriculae TaxID=3039180 RepID=A0AAU0UJZ9_9FIRM|nr:hypothetical protein MFMK1_000637 [Desulfitibacteraceae bacterium MK1]
MRNINLLEQERNALLTEWLRAKETEKAKLLVRIMDIDERLELNKQSEASN